ncbi:MAG: phage portal protein [Glycocaulis sp.]
MPDTAMPALLDHNGAPIPEAQRRAARLRSAAMAMVQGADRPWQGASVRDQALTNWNPAAVPADPDPYDRQRINARVRDLIRNSGMASAAVQKNTDMVVGHAFRLISLPDHAALGISPADAMKLGRAIETAFRSWAHDPYRRCDRVRRHSFAGLINLLYRERCQTGEEFCIVRDAPRPGWKWRTAIQVVDTDRLSNPNDMPDTDRLRDGIEIDEAGEPLAYHVRNTHPLDPVVGTDTFTWTRVPKETSWGRPIAIHGFESQRPEQRRGISPFAAILAPFRMLDRHAESELASAVANSLFVAFISSDYNPYQLAESLGLENPDAEAKDWHDVRKSVYGGLGLKLAGSSIPVLPPGDEIKLNTSPRQTSEFVDFRASFLQEMATALGIPYPVLAERWDKVNYSSARAALEEWWRSVKSRRLSFVEQTVNPIFIAWLEEAFAFGHIETPPGAPDYYDNPAAYTRALWIGPGRGHIDPKREREASEIGLRNNLTTLQKEASQQGDEWEELLLQRAREEAFMGELNLPRYVPRGGEAQVPDENPDLEPVDS